MVGYILAGIIIGGVIGYLFASRKSKLLDGKYSEISSQLTKRDSELSELRLVAGGKETELRGLHTRLAESETARTKDYEAMQEKFALLEEAKEKFIDAFGELSRQALSTNSQDFLKLAKTELDRHQIEAKNDLERRQQSI